mmetsp:Transcript_8309/g.18577  ORF Transcript_8309/g.18577 Transcript_8309/m.18577 type:complete len:450 (+) Transcript_8309:263-1612(+)
MAAAAALRQHRCGASTLVLYEGENLWHERCLLFPVCQTAGDHRWVILTPDGDRYIEHLATGAAEDGPIQCRLLGENRRLPALGGVPVYRFNPWPGDDELRGVLQLARAEAHDACRVEGLPLLEIDQVINGRRREVTLEDFFRRAVPWARVPAAGALAPRGPAAPGAAAAGAAPAPMAGVNPAVRANEVWLVSLDAGGLQRGHEIVPVAGDYLGQKYGVHTTAGGAEVPIVKVALQDVHLWGPLPPAAASGSAGAMAEDMRTLAVKYDELGERHRQFRESVGMMQADDFGDFPIEGPRSCMWLLRMWSKSGLDPVQWLERHLAVAGWADTDRSGHELRVLSHCFLAASCYDQINCPSLACMEYLARRYQMILDAHNDNPLMPDYSSSEYWLDVSRTKNTVDPTLKAHIARQLKDDTEVKKQLQKSRELRSQTPAAPKAAAAKKAGAPNAP